VEILGGTEENEGFSALYLRGFAPLREIIGLGWDGRGGCPRRRGGGKKRRGLFVNVGGLSCVEILGDTEENEGFSALYLRGFAPSREIIGLGWDGRGGCPRRRGGAEVGRRGGVSL
jgi:hypothetical protein